MRRTRSLILEDSVHPRDNGLHKRPAFSAYEITEITPSSSATPADGQQPHHKYASASSPPLGTKEIRYNFRLSPSTQTRSRLEKNVSTRSTVYSSSPIFYLLQPPTPVVHILPAPPPPRFLPRVGTPRLRACLFPHTGRMFCTLVQQNRPTCSARIMSKSLLLGSLTVGQLLAQLSFSVICYSRREVYPLSALAISLGSSSLLVYILSSLVGTILSSFFCSLSNVLYIQYSTCALASLIPLHLQPCCPLLSSHTRVAPYASVDLVSAPLAPRSSSHT
ncbi:hypothetical protein BGX38DRAFT_819595 [Terfezia claveryi]|nr:hypothetical protein BGX38DRAFT_819595 [Terfezia claveryi]